MKVGGQLAKPAVKNIKKTGEKIVKTGTSAVKKTNTAISDTKKVMKKNVGPAISKVARSAQSTITAGAKAVVHSGSALATAGTQAVKEVSKAGQSAIEGIGNKIQNMVKKIPFLGALVGGVGFLSSPWLWIVIALVVVIGLYMILRKKKGK